MTLYDILEISENASEEVIKVAYKALAKKYHPDVFKGDSKEAEKKMKQINEAFETLSDEHKRRRYDEFLRNKRRDSKAGNNTESQSQEQKNIKREDVIHKKDSKFSKVKKKTAIIFAIVVVALLVIVAGSFFMKNISILDEKESFYGYDAHGNLREYTYNNKTNSFVDPEGNEYPENRKQHPDYYVDISGEVYNLQGYGRCAIVRTLSFENRAPAEYIYEQMKQVNFDEMEIIAIMDYNETVGHVIEPGYYPREVDNWCFDSCRNSGDVAIIETDFGYTICYISAVFD